MRALFYCLLLLLGLAPVFTLRAQDIPLEKVDRDTYTFSTKELALIKDFRMDGPTYHITDDPYSFKLVALTENGQTDTTVTGFYPFLINEQEADVRFLKGQGMVELNLGKADEISVQLANTTLKKELDIWRRPGWPALLGVAGFLLLTFAFRHQLALAWRKLTGGNK